MDLPEAFVKQSDAICVREKMSKGKIATKATLTRSTVNPILNKETLVPYMITIKKMIDGANLLVSQFFRGGYFAECKSQYRYKVTDNNPAPISVQKSSIPLTEIRIVLTKRILYLARRGGISQEWLAKRSGVSLITIQSIINGSVKSPRVSTVEKLCASLGISVYEFFNTGLFKELLQEIY